MSGAVLIEQVLYSTACLAIVVAIFNFQSGRHKHAKGCLWWAYNAMVLGVGWEIVDCWLYGPPGFPASRWIVMPCLAFVLNWATMQDRRDRRMIRLIDADELNGVTR